MNNINLFKGYDSAFITGKIVELPRLNEEQLKDLIVDSEGNNIINYINYSLQFSTFYKFPYYTATNIDGLKFKKVPRKDNWRKDPRIPKEFQFGKEFYTLPKSNFDKGHMTKREDVQWGDTIAIALNAADSTFYYTNAIPQHKDLNRDIWRSLEDYILHTETRKKELKINVYTGPVLSSQNPYFVTPLDEVQVQIPVLFWKVVIFEKDDGNLYRVGFIMGQNKLLIQDDIIESLESDNDLFNEFADAETYQVNIELIEELSGINMPLATDSYTDSRNIKLVLQEIDIDPDLESFSDEHELGFIIENLKL
jgi:endonuclease G